jgi:hypothetical protein
VGGGGEEDWSRSRDGRDGSEERKRSGNRARGGRVVARLSIAAPRGLYGLGLART